MASRARSLFISGRAIVAAATFALASHGSAARADDDQAVAGQLFQAGLAAYAHHDYKAAARAFEEANVHAPRAETMFNAGLAWEAAGDDARGADAYSAALAGGELRAQDAEKAHRQLGALVRSLGLVRVVAPPGGKVSVAHVAGAAIPVDVHVHPGDYDVSVERSDGTTATQHVRVAAGATVNIALEASHAHPAAALPAPPPAGTAVTATPPLRPDEPQGHGAAGTWGWIALGGGAAMAIAAGAIGYEGLQARDAFERSGETSVHDHDQAATDRTLANVAWGIAGASAIAGVALLFVSRRGATPGPQAALVAVPRGAGVRVSF